MAPFGICSLPGVCCYLMSQVLSGLDFYFAYHDDILAYSATWKEHLQYLEIGLKCLKKANLKIKHSKCQLFNKHLNYVGHLISKHGIKPLTGKLSAIRKVKEPNNIDELYHFWD